jgi:hypothetical protein
MRGQNKFFCMKFEAITYLVILTGHFYFGPLFFNSIISLKIYNCVLI